MYLARVLKFAFLCYSLKLQLVHRKEVFWDLFDDYEARGGDGFIHSKVEPVMRELKVIDKE